MLFIFNLKIICKNIGPINSLDIYTLTHNDSINFKGWIPLIVALIISTLFFLIVGMNPIYALKIGGGHVHRIQQGNNAHLGISLPAHPSPLPPCIALTCAPHPLTPFPCSFSFSHTKKAPPIFAHSLHLLDSFWGSTKILIENIFF